MEFRIGDIVDHPNHGVGIVAQRFLSASGKKELYNVVFVRVIPNNGVMRVFGEELSLIRHTELEVLGGQA